MSIRELKPDGTVTVNCIACGGDRDIAPGEVELGRSLPGNKAEAADPESPPVIDPDSIVLPPCLCGAVTQYQQNHDTILPAWVGSRFDLQRRAVNAYAKKLKQLGRKNAACAAAIDAQPDPPDLMDASAIKNMPIAAKRKHRAS